MPLVEKASGTLQQAGGSGHVTAVDRPRAGQTEVAGSTFA
jgi:hypothetical protein